MQLKALLFTALLVGSAVAFAQGKGNLPEPPKGYFGLLIAPPRYELVLTPGERVKKEFAVVAKGYDHAIRAAVAVQDWTLSPEGKIIALNPGQNPYSAAPWVQTALDPLSLEPDKPIVLPFEVRVPKAGLSGSYWTAVTFTTESPPHKNKRGIAVVNRLRIWGIVYVTIAGTEAPGAEIANFGFGSEKKNLILDVQNTGNVYLRLHGTLTYKDQSGKTIKAEKLPERVLLRDLLVRYRIPVKAVPKEAVVASVEVTAKGLTSPLYAEVALK